MRTLRPLGVLTAGLLATGTPSLADEGAAPEPQVVEANETVLVIDEALPDTITREELEFIRAWSALKIRGDVNACIEVDTGVFAMAGVELPELDCGGRDELTLSDAAFRTMAHYEEGESVTFESQARMLLDFASRMNEAGAMLDRRTARGIHHQYILGELERLDTQVFFEKALALHTRVLTNDTINSEDDRIATTTELAELEAECMEMSDRLADLIDAANAPMNARTRDEYRDVLTWREFQKVQAQYVDTAFIDDSIGRQLIVEHSFPQLNAEAKAPTENTILALESRITAIDAQIFTVETGLSGSIDLEQDIAFNTELSTLRALRAEKAGLESQHATILFGDFDAVMSDEEDADADSLEEKDPRLVVLETQIADVDAKIAAQGEVVNAFITGEASAESISTQLDRRDKLVMEKANLQGEIARLLGHDVPNAEPADVVAADAESTVTGFALDIDTPGEQQEKIFSQATTVYGWVTLMNGQLETLYTELGTGEFYDGMGVNSALESTSDQTSDETTPVAE